MKAKFLAAAALALVWTGCAAAADKPATAQAPQNLTEAQKSDYARALAATDAKIGNRPQTGVQPEVMDAFLIEAARQNDHARALAAIDLHANVKATADLGATALLWA